jgi:hypothetical protein
MSKDRDTMNDTRTTSILQRLPTILAVTAASYGLPLQSRGRRMHAAAQGRRTAAGHNSAAERAHKNKNPRR